MSQKNSKSQDEISKLLDSFQVEDTLEEKMDVFKSEKERKTRLERARRNAPNFQRRYQEEVDLTQVIQPIEEEPVSLGARDYDEVSQTRTMMWEKDEIEEEIADTNKTVVINDKEIQSLLEDEKSPKLTREVHKGPSKKPNKGNDKRTTMIVVAGVIGVLLTCLVVFGAVQLMSDFLNLDNITEEERKEKYKEILDWANDYDFLSDVEKEKIIQLEKDFNKLSDKEKTEINKVLREKTGKSFDELLAKTKSDKKDKEDHSNNNTQIAQQKAKLREEINKVKSDLRSVQNEFNSAKSALDTANAEYSSLEQEIGSAQSQIDALTTRINELKTLYDGAKQEHDTLYRQYLDLPFDDPARPDIWAQIEAKKADMDTYMNEKVQAESTLPGVQQKLEKANAKLGEAKSKVDSAQSAYDSAKSKVDSINTELQRLQSQLDALDEN